MLSFGMNQQAKQRIQQMLKQELSQKLRLVLVQLLSLIHSLRFGQKLTMKAVTKLQSAVAGMKYDDRQRLAHELVRRSRTGNAIAIQRVLFAVGKLRSDEAMCDFALAINDKLEMRLQNRQRVDQGIKLGLRQIMILPEFFGSMPGTAENLEKLLKAAPQYNDLRDEYEWVLAGGWAVELLTETNLRHHHDLDAVLLTQTPLYLDCDVVHTEDYFGVISCTRRFIDANCIQDVGWYHNETWHSVAVLCPEFLFLSKILRPPRPQDWDDAQLLVTHFSDSWDLSLMLKIIKRSNCGFTQTRRLMRLLRTRDVSRIIAGLTAFK